MRVAVIRHLFTVVHLWLPWRPRRGWRHRRRRLSRTRRRACRRRSPSGRRAPRPGTTASPRPDLRWPPARPTAGPPPVRRHRLASIPASSWLTPATWSYTTPARRPALSDRCRVRRLRQSAGCQTSCLGPDPSSVPMNNDDSAVQVPVSVLYTTVCKSKSKVKKTNLYSALL